MTLLLMFIMSVTLFYILIVVSYAGKLNVYGIKGKLRKYLSGPFVILGIGYRISKSMDLDEGHEKKFFVSQSKWLLNSIQNFENNTAFFAIILREVLTAPVAQRNAFLESVRGSIIEKNIHKPTANKSDNKTKTKVTSPVSINSLLVATVKNSLSGIRDGDFVNAKYKIS